MTNNLLDLPSEVLHYILAHKAQIETISQAVDRLLNTSKPHLSASHNLAFLSCYFHRHKDNRRLLLAASSLYRWAESDAWRHHPSCAHYRENSPAEIAETHQAEEEGDDADDNGDMEEESDLSRVFGRRDQREMGDTFPDYGGGGTSSPVPLPEPEKREVHRRQLSAKLHCLYGIPIQEVHRASTTSQRYAFRYNTAPIHPYARSRVYDLRQHTGGSLWGPFLDDGTQDVDWEKMEAIMLVVNHNMRIFAQHTDSDSDRLVIPAWEEPFDGAPPYSYISRKTDLPMEPKLPLEANDPYSVTGTWMRVVCFLDYPELFDFNFAGSRPPPTQPRPALDTEEAIRLITFRLVITKVQEPGEEDGKGLPVVHFKGTSSSVRPSWDPHNAHSKIKGECSMSSEIGLHTDRSV
ncbi:MAG: hypothetical protein Q9217_006687 [Psora testacea]